MTRGWLKSIFAAAALLALSGLAASAETVWNRGNSADPESLDPHKTSTVYEAHILKDLFEGLVMQDAKAALIPGAAESWTVSADGTVYTFKLRDNGVWSNGDPVTADDFVYSFRRLEDPATAAEYASMLYVIKNAQAVNEGKAKPEEIGVRAIDPKTLEITLNAPTPYFLEMLTHQSTYPVNRASIEKLGADWIKPGNLVSNGAFTLAEFVPNDHIRLVKNPKFHDAANVKLDAVNYIPTEDRSTAMKRYEAGELDSNDDIPTEQLADIQAKFGDQVRLGPYLGTYYYAVAWDKAPWDNIKLRRAISMAIDRDFLAEKVWGNSMIPAYGMVPPASPATRPPRPTTPRWTSSTARRGEEDPDRIGLWPGPPAEARDPLQHLGEPQEHGHRHPAAAQALRRRRDHGQHRHQDPLRLSRAEGRFRLRPRRLDRRLQGSRILPRHLPRRERQQLFALQEPEIRGGDGQGGSRRRRPGRALPPARRSRADRP